MVPVKKRLSNSLKNVIFKMIAVLLPFILLIIFELILRVFGYGADLSIFISDDNSSPFLHLNKNVSKRYFIQAENATFGSQETFLKKKTPETFRIFVLGASTAVGFPYYHNGSFARMLQYRLQRTFPEKKIEIINLSLTAINTYALLDFSKAVAKQEPDAVFFYEGHNEYYGALGVASTSNLGNNSMVVKSSICLKKLRLVQLLFNISSKFRKDASLVTDQRENLMRRMARDQKIIFNSELYKLGIKQFDANLEQILEIFSVRNIPVFLSTLVSNEKDLKPMLSERTGQNIEDKQWEENFTNGEKLLLNGDTAKAYKIFSDLNKVDSTYALTHYYLGRIAYKAGKFSEAKAYFRNASELDALRFRGPEQMNEIIRKKAGKFKNVLLVDTKKTFEANSPHGIIGNELILEHLHPNLKGYFLISVAFYDALKASKLLSKEWGNEIQPEKIYRELPLTKVDSLYGLYGTWFLKEGWPFNEPIPVEEKRERTFEEKLAGGLVTRQVKWGEAMNALYEQYLKESNYVGALKITEGLILEFPYDVRLYSRALKLASELKYYDLANYYGRKGFLLDSNFEFARALFINYLKIDKPDLAMPFIDFCIKNNNGSVDLGPLKVMVDEILTLKGKIEETATQIEYLKRIAQNYFMMGNYEAATKYIKVVLQAKPDDKETLSLVTEIRKEGFKEI